MEQTYLLYFRRDEEQDRDNEYVVITDEKPAGHHVHCRDGFTLYKTVEIDDDCSAMPMYRELSA